MKRNWIGLAGVSANENPNAIRIAQVFEWPMVVLAIWIVLEWYLLANDQIHEDSGFWTNLFILMFFMAETLILTRLVDDKRTYLKSNWLNLLIIVSSVPLLLAPASYAAVLRLFRLLVLANILLNISSGFRLLVSRHHLGITLVICFIITLMAGVLMAGLDPAFGSISDGLWWAWVTVSTVGYGDLVPSTTAGRIFGSILIAMGIGIFAMLTASFSAFFMSQEERTVVAFERLGIHKLDAIEARLEKLENQLARLAETLEKLENQPAGDDSNSET